MSRRGDARRVKDVVSELFTERKLPLPAVSVLQVGALADDAAQVVIEAVVETKREANPNGLAFWSGQTAPSFEAALQKLENSVETAAVPPDHVLTCPFFTSRMGDAGGMRASIQRAFPKTEINVVQALREPMGDTSSCEAVGQLTAAPAQGRVVLLQDSRAALVSTDRLIFTGLQLTFGDYLDDASVAYSRLERAARALDPITTPVVVNVFSFDASTASAFARRCIFPL